VQESSIYNVNMEAESRFKECGTAVYVNIAEE
jgi:hypothetical protein